MPGPAKERAEIHLLDVGDADYGDAILAELGHFTVLFDGAHPGNQKASNGHESIQDQIGELLGSAGKPQVVDLLVVTHAHNDHITFVDGTRSHSPNHFGVGLFLPTDMISTTAT